MVQIIGTLIVQQTRRRDSHSGQHPRSDDDHLNMFEIEGKSFNNNNKKKNNNNDDDRS